MSRLFGPHTKICFFLQGFSFSEDFYIDQKNRILHLEIPPSQCPLVSLGWVWDLAVPINNKVQTAIKWPAENRNKSDAGLVSDSSFGISLREERPHSSEILHRCMVI